jgi:hypothetical protein
MTIAELLVNIDTALTGHLDKTQRADVDDLALAEEWKQEIVRRFADVARLARNFEELHAKGEKDFCAMRKRAETAETRIAELEKENEGGATATPGLGAGR